MAIDSSPSAHKLSEQYAFQTSLIQLLVDDISHEENLLQLPFEANCMNWILGHILSRRQSSLVTLAAEPLWAEQQLSRYKTGSEPIVSSEQAIHFNVLKDDLRRSLERIQSALEESNDETLERIVVNDRGEKSAQRHLEGFLWHESYHIGQLELQRAYIFSARSDSLQNGCTITSGSKIDIS